MYTDFVITRNTVTDYDLTLETVSCFYLLRQLDTVSYYMGC